MTAEQLVLEARRLLDETPAGTTSAWPRAAALLCRQALEDTLDALWAASHPYELDPVREELDPLITTTRKLIVSVAVHAPGPSLGRGDDRQARRAR